MPTKNHIDTVIVMYRDQSTASTEQNAEVNEEEETEQNAEPNEGEEKRTKREISRPQYLKDYET